MQDLLEKGYANKSTEQTPLRRKRYIPHHGVSHPINWRNIRVGGAFQGASLNKNLMSGPHLVNQIVRVKIRFCKEPLLIMGDT